MRLASTTPRLATFPDEFRQGMAARAAILGDTGANHPDHWVGGLASPDLHAIVILFARDVPERERCVREHQQYAAQFPGVEALSTLDLEATPPLDYAHDHFGYRDRMSQPEIEGMGIEPTPGTGAPLKPGEFFLGYPDENGDTGPLPQPEILSRNGSFLAYRRMDEHVGAFRDFLRANGATPEEQELVAAKLMGRWRSGAPLVLAPTKDDPQLAADPQRNNNFDYGKMDPHGYAVPLGAHIRRMNPRDTAVNMNRRRIIRRGGTYGPPLPEGAHRRRCRTRDRRLCRLRQSDQAVRVRAKRVGERSQVPRARQRAGSVHRHAGRLVRHDHPETADQEKDHGAAGIHDA